MLRPFVFVFVASVYLPIAVSAEEHSGPGRWSAPPSWQVDGKAASSPMPFVAVTPCRLLDTRNSPGDYGAPALVAGEPRSFVVGGQCDVPLGAAAVSINITATNTQGAGFVALYPEGESNPGVSNVNYAAASQTVANAAVVPLGPGGFTAVAGVSGTDVIVDVNGYYAPQDSVSTVNALTGDVTIAAGANVTVTPSDNTLTIAATPAGVTAVNAISGAVTLAAGPNVTVTPSGNTLTIAATPAGVTAVNAISGAVTLAAGPNVTVTPSGNTLTIAATGGATLPSGRANETLRHNGSAWEASSAFTNNGFDVRVGGSIGVSHHLSLATTSSSNAGVIMVAGTKFIHTFGPKIERRPTNTFVGSEAGNLTMGGTEGQGGYNTAIGYDSQRFTTTGQANTAIGYQSLRNNKLGDFNTAVGSDSLLSNWLGSSNTAVGRESMVLNSIGTWNTAVGEQSMAMNTGGAFNTAVGRQSLGSNSTGSWNTAVGERSGIGNTVGKLNTFIGTGTGAFTPDLENATAIGYGAGVNSSNSVRVGNSRVTQIGGQVAWSALSDARHKENIQDLDLGLTFVRSLRPVSFTLKTGDGRTDMGFLAQDVQTLLGESYSVLGIGGDEDRTLSLRYTDLMAPMVKAIQEQQATIEGLVRDREALQARLEALEALLRAARESHTR